MRNLAVDDLIILIAEDDRKAFDVFYNIYYKQIFRFVYYHLKDTHICREVVSNVFFAVWCARNSLPKIKIIEAYLYTIARNEVKRFVAKNFNSHHVSVDELPIHLEYDPHDNPHERLIGAEAETMIARVISQLPEKCRVIFMLSRNDGLSNTEIAERLSISESTIRVQIKIAIEKITVHLKKALSL